MNTFNDRLIMLALFLVVVFIIWFIVEFFLFPYYKHPHHYQPSSQKPSLARPSIFSEILQGPILAIVAAAILIIGIAIFSYVERASQYQDLDSSKSNIHMRVLADDFSQLKNTHDNFISTNDQVSLNAFNRNLSKEHDICIERGKMFEGKNDANATIWYKRGLMLDEILSKGHPKADSYSCVAASLDNEHKWREADSYYAKAERQMSQQLFSNNGKDPVSFTSPQKSFEWLPLTGVFVNGEYKGTVVCNARLQRLLKLIKDTKCLAVLPYSRQILESKNQAIPDKTKHYSILDLRCLVKDLRAPTKDNKRISSSRAPSKGKVLREQEMQDLLKKASKQEIISTMPYLAQVYGNLGKVTHCDFPNATIPGTFLLPTNTQQLMPETIYILDASDYQKLKSLSR